MEKALDRIAQEIDILREEMEPEGEEAPLEEPAPEVGGGEDTEEAVCPVCGRAVSLSDQECPDCGAIFEIEAADGLLEPEEQAYCPICGEFVDLVVSTCPSCGADFELEEEPLLEALKPMPARAIKKLHVVPKPKVIKDHEGLMTVAREAGAERARGLSNGASVTNGTGMINGKSLINGRGQINGAHLVNGKGIINGRDLVNGMGILNGSAGRRHYPLTAKERLPFYARWQFIAVLVAIVVTAPTVLHLVTIGEEMPHAIDGDFSDWDIRTTFTATAASADQVGQTIEWSVDSYGETVFLYIRAEESLMTSSEAERFVLFMDSDDSDATGYMVGGFGADFMMEIFGWNESIRSSLLLEFCSDDDRLNWSQWSNARYVKSSVAQSQLEAMARLPACLNESAKFILTAQTQRGVTCISHPVAMDGGLLIVEQQAAPGISSDGILQRGTSTSYARLRFTCQGVGGSVESVTPTLSGLPSFEPIGSFAIEVGEEHVVDLRVDSSALVDGQFVSVAISQEKISSTFRYTRVVGCPVSAYAYAPPGSVTIDGAFADWEGRTTDDMDGTTLENLNIDIDQVGTNITDERSYFFVGVNGYLCAGAYVPKTCTSYISPGGATTVPARRTGEDIIRIYIDSDRSSASGMLISVGPLTIGADHMIEVCGLCCKITSVQSYLYIAGAWALIPMQLDAAKDESRVEIGVLADAIGGTDSFDFLVEATDWRGEADYASNQTTFIWPRTWVVDSSGTSQYATSLSYQRKLLYDGENFWSFYFDGSDTVCEYSDDGGATWTSRGSVFKTSGVREVSVWHDSTNSVVYAVGDSASATRYIYVQKGSVSSSTSTISWAASDSAPTVSTEATSEKNSYISRDANGYLWILCTDLTRTSPQVKYQLGSWQSDSINDITAWTSRGDLLPSAQTQDSDICGSIVPAGTGSDMWAIFAYDGKVFSKKRTSGTWESSEQTIYSESGSQDENTFNSPPSAVVGDSQVVHVVYGDMSEEGGYSKPAVWYTHNQTGATTWATSIDLDSSKPSNVGNKYPTISVDSATGDLYAFWMRTDTSSVPSTVMGKTKSDGGSWTSISFGAQSSCVKHYLTSIYSVDGESKVCWLWTQNTTGTIEVFFDVIPEFDDVIVPVLTTLAMFTAFILRRRVRNRCGRPDGSLTGGRPGDELGEGTAR
ncbi:MAG: zinc ribbon domain-containing protein [Methanobacteriota archaeon]|nr:MAG: zinc ribbon domain-containing protein [Euryarchaeota archaeon]